MQVFRIRPRGFCAGVKRAVAIVEGALAKYGTPIYVKHEIVHNEYVIQHFKSKGVIFIEDLTEVPQGSKIIFSAHGVSKNVEDIAAKQNLHTIDATCPLVKKVHRFAMQHEKEGKITILIGHKGHPEIEGILGRVQAGKIILIQNIQEVEDLHLKDDSNLAYLTQTTLSIDETSDIISALKHKFPNIASQDDSDICYATQNRQIAVKNLIKQIDLLLVLGSQASSNAARLKDIGLANAVDSYLINSVQELRDSWIYGKKAVGISSGASTPEVLVQEVAQHLADNFGATITDFGDPEDFVEFHVPKEVRGEVSSLF